MTTTRICQDGITKATCDIDDNRTTPRSVTNTTFDAAMACGQLGFDLPCGNAGFVQTSEDCG